MNEIHTATAAPPDDDGRRAEKRRRVEHAAAHPAPTALKLKQSESANVAALVDSCRVQLGTTYSPTFSKARDVIKELHQAASGKGKAKGGGGGKQTKGMPPLSKAAFLDVCTEYVMLHLGNTKWRARRWEGAPDPATVAGGGNGPAEDEDDAESESESSAAIGGRCSPAGTETERAGCSSSDDTDDASANDAHTDGAGDGAANAVGCAADTSAGPPATARSRSPSTSPAAVPSSSPPASAMACDAPGTGATPAGASGHGAPAQSAANGVNSRAVDPPGRMPTDGAIVVPTSAALGARVSLTSAAVAREGDFSSTWRVPGTALEAGPTIGSADLARVAAVPWSGHLALAPPALDVTDSRAVGRWGEALVYAYLVATTRNAVVEWVNEVGETRAPYDIVVTDRDGKWSRTRYAQTPSPPPPPPPATATSTTVPWSTQCAHATLLYRCTPSGSDRGSRQSRLTVGARDTPLHTLGTLRSKRRGTTTVTSASSRRGSGRLPRKSPDSTTMCTEWKGRGALPAP